MDNSSASNGSRGTTTVGASLDRSNIVYGTSILRPRHQSSNTHDPRLNRVWDGLLDAIRQMQVSTDELRRLSNRNHVPDYLEYVHKNSVVHAMSVVTEIAEGLDTVSIDLEEVLIGLQPLLEDYEALGLYDDFQSDGHVDGDCNDEWVSVEESSLDSDEIND